MFTKLILFTSFSIMAANAYADSCNLNHLNFGMGQDKIKSEFKLDTPDVSTQGATTIITGAPEICKELPERAVVEFSLIDDKFVEMRVINENTSGVLYEYAAKIFGAKDNKTRDQRKSKTTEKVKLGLWSKDNGYSVIYTVHTAGTHELEKLTITSSKHKELFDKANKTKSKATNDYLKEKKLGKYNPNYKGAPVDDSSDQTQDNDNKKHSDRD